MSFRDDTKKTANNTKERQCGSGLQDTISLVPLMVSGESWKEVGSDDCFQDAARKELKASTAHERNRNGLDIECSEK